MPKSNEDMAMDAVILDMGRAATKAKAGKYAGKPKLGEESQPVAPQDTGDECGDTNEMPSEEELSVMLGGG